jgi:hypothetical protein
MYVKHLQPSLTFVGNLWSTTYNRHYGQAFNEFQGKTL